MRLLDGTTIERQSTPKFQNRGIIEYAYVASLNDSTIECTGIGEESVCLMGRHILLEMSDGSVYLIRYTKDEARDFFEKCRVAFELYNEMEEA